ncbi:nicotinate-nucleotide adenylyltransferase [Pseudoalteromonas mariniglutinosa]|uniref:nicotinate-nucleotide adenylyltransferase n=1 Tax=Pseudoalteromonas mariniglutinosa TaxID=206042 RepID=UPI00384B9531
MIAIFGGTFDPIHLGHINMAKECVKQCQLDTLYFMPCATPAHKAAPRISNTHRIKMLELAIQPYSYFALDLRELSRQGPSYSLLSLQEVRAEYPQQPILFLIGMDSFNNLDKWYRWHDIVKLCHIVVYQRPAQNDQPSTAVLAYQQQAQTNDVTELTQSLSGKLFFLKGIEISAASSEIRKRLPLATELLTPQVSQYIAQQQLYQTDE